MDLLRSSPRSIPRPLLRSLAALLLVACGDGDESAVVDRAASRPLVAVREAIESSRGHEAAERAAEWLRDHPEDAQMRALLAEALLRNGDSALAWKEAERAGDAVTPLLRAEILIEEGRFDEAIPWLERAAVRRADDPSVRERLGACLVEADRTEEAIAVLDPLARADPPVGRSAFHLANALAREGRAQEAAAAREIWRNVQRRHEAEQLRTEGVRASEAGDLATARDYLLRAADLAPEHPELANDLGVVLARMSRFDEALPWFERSTERHPESAAAWRNLAACRRRLGDEAGAARAEERFRALARKATSLPEEERPE